MDPYFFGFALSLFSLFLLLVNAILFSSKLKSNKSIVYKYVSLYLIILFLVESFCNAMGYLNPGENFFLSHFYFNAQFALLSAVFYHLFTSSKLKKVILFNYVVVTLIIAIMFLRDLDSFWNFNLFEIAATSVLLIVYSIIHLYNTLHKEKQYFYLLIGLIMYLLCSSIIFLFGNYELVFIKDPYIDIWIFNTLFYIIYQVLIYKEWTYIKKGSQ